MCRAGGHRAPKTPPREPGRSPKRSERPACGAKLPHPGTHLIPPAGQGTVKREIKEIPIIPRIPNAPRIIRSVPRSFASSWKLSRPASRSSARRYGRRDWPGVCPQLRIQVPRGRSALPHPTSREETPRIWGFRGGGRPRDRGFRGGGRPRDASGGAAAQMWHGVTSPRASKGRAERATPQPPHKPDTGAFGVSQLRFGARRTGSAIGGSEGPPCPQGTRQPCVHHELHPGQGGGRKRPPRFCGWKNTGWET